MSNEDLMELAKIIYDAEELAAKLNQELEALDQARMRVRGQIDAARKRAADHQTVWTIYTKTLEPISLIKIRDIS